MSIFSFGYERNFKVNIKEANATNPFVILIGWISSSPKNLKKYVEWYNANGFDIVWFTPKDSYQYEPIKLIHSALTSYMEHLAKDLLAFIQEIFPKRRFFFHTFSGNSVCYSYIVQHMEESLASLALGSIFDSTPNHISRDNAYNSVTLTSKSNVFNYLVWIVFGIYDIIVDVPAMDKAFFSRLSNSKIFAPQLYFYSQDDQVCPAPVIEEWIKEEKKRVIVFSKSWDKSKHVGHFQKHNQEYTSKTLEFMDYCIHSKM